MALLSLPLLGSLSIWQAAALCFGVTTFAMLIHGFWSWYRMRHIPGPFLASVSVYWMLKKAFGGNYHVDLHNLALKYGECRTNDKSLRGIARGDCGD
jgi:hypothetical protein